MAWWDSITGFFKRDTSAEVGPQAPSRRHPPGAQSGTGFDSVSSVAKRLRLEASRRAHYDDFEQMDREAPEAHRALDSFTDTATQDGGTGSVLQFEFHVPGVEQVIQSLNLRTRLPERAWGHLRQTRHMGEHFVEQVFAEDGTTVRIKDLPVREIERMTDEFGIPEPFPWRQVRGSTGGAGGRVLAHFREWQVVQFGDVPAGKMYAYTRSQLAAARRPWRALELAQNAILAERVLHTGTRLAFTLDVTGLSTDEAIEYMREVKADYALTQSHSVSSGGRHSQLAPLVPFDDLFVPWTQGGPQKPVEVLRFGAEIGEIADVKFVYGRFLSALEVPRYELGLDEDIRSKAATNVIDAGYLRRVMRARMVYLRGIVQIYNRALFALGFDRAMLGDHRELYSVSFSPLQLIDEKLRWEIAKLRADVAKIYGLDLNVVSEEFVLRHFLGLDDDGVAIALSGDRPQPPAKTSLAAEGRLPPGDPYLRLIDAVGADTAAATLGTILNLIDLKAKPPSSDLI